VFKGNRKYIVFFLLVFAAIVYVQMKAPRPVNWRKTYKQKDMIPFGCNAMYELLDRSAFKDKMEVTEETIYSGLDSTTEARSSTIFINDLFKIDDIETRMLLNYVSKGNKVLIAANFFDGKLADTLKIKTNLSYGYFIPKKEEGKFTVVYHQGLKDQRLYSYNDGVTPSYFTSFDTSRAKIIAADTNKNPLFISLQFGKGTFYLMSNPEVFANYNVVNRLARNYPYKALSYIDMPRICWDENYKTYNSKIKNPLQFIFGNDALYAAYSVALLSILLFMVFNLKRRQRPIPVITPPSNSTLDFVEVIGNVYFNAKNHKIIAEEKINSFLDTIRFKFQVNTQLITNDVLKRIAALSGIERTEIDTLFERIETIQYKRTISEKQLIELNTLIEQFHKKNKR
jgi:hypothetical protein